MRRFLSGFWILVFPLITSAQSVTVSGISSGGFMAAQMATIYSDQIHGVATVAGGVYYCAQNHFQEKMKKYGPQSQLLFRSSLQGQVEPLLANPHYISVGVCMAHPERAHGGENGPMSLGFLNLLAERGLIAPLENISKQKVLIYQGRHDEVVRFPMADKLREFYSRLGVSDSHLKIIHGEGNHNFPTDRTEGIECDEAKVPYIAKCGLDLAGELLQHLLGRPLHRSTPEPRFLVRVQQFEAPSSVAAYGYFYANEFCLKNPRRCDLHVALHGCKMNDDFDENFQNLYQSKIAMTQILKVLPVELAARVPRQGAAIFAEQAGYLEYAASEKNRLMIYFPQTQITDENYPSNPKGCWDWFGWTSPQYATNRGPETSWLMSQIQILKINPASVIKKDSPTK